MNTYHVSYAVGFPCGEYVRARRYVPEAQGLEGTDIAPDYGLRQMWGKRSLYRDFRAYEAVEVSGARR